VPDLILLDWMLPGTSGLELARRLRKEELSREIPIIMLTARGEEMDRVNGLEAGVDDYVVKPFSTRELIARIKAVLRRSHGDDGSGMVEAGTLRIDGPAHRVFAGDEPVPIGPTEYRLLYFFMTHRRARLFAHAHCSTMSGAAACTWRSAPSTCTFGACARRWSRGSSTIWCRPCAAPATASRPASDPAGVLAVAPAFTDAGALPSKRCGATPE
jgi:Response regulators consisting of a CheY-like receiver domain and a winged-helix DNA-binding domain